MLAQPMGALQEGSLAPLDALSEGESYCMYSAAKDASQLDDREWVVPDLDSPTHRAVFSRWRFSIG